MQSRKPKEDRSNCQAKNGLTQPIRIGGVHGRPIARNNVTHVTTPKDLK
jgi:hypothetical protein